MRGKEKLFEKVLSFPRPTILFDLKRRMIYNVKDFGAYPNGRLCTKEIQSAIDACFLAGGGEVTVPEGDFFTGGLRLRSNVTLHLLENARLIGSITPEDYCVYLEDKIEPIGAELLDSVAPTAMPDCKKRSVMPYSRWNNALIRVINAENVAIIGERGSMIDGRNCFDELGEEKYRGPHAINVWFTRGITLSGYTVKDSANWAHAIQNSRDIVCKNVTVLGGHDGIDLRTCDNILIENCSIMTGDDCVAGFDNINVIVRNCTLESACSLFRFGGRHVLVENCTGRAATRYGFRGNLTPEEKRARADTHKGCRHNCLTVYLSYSDNRAVIRERSGDTLFRNCEFHNPDTILNVPYGHVWCCNGSLNDVTFENCDFYGVINPSNLSGCPDEPIAVTFRDCKISAREGYESIPLIEGESAKSISFDNVSFENFKSPEIKCNPDCAVSVKDCCDVAITRVSKMENKSRFFL